MRIAVPTDDGHQCTHGEAHTGHSHSTIVDALAGCQVVCAAEWAAVPPRHSGRRGFRP
ncbi:MAG TPA: hypothetical protein VN442_01325 [Bryobacteraceae bacterium]|nr:hypothetical protein [Bryobacteraceae bacterium]